MKISTRHMTTTVSLGYAQDVVSALLASTVSADLADDLLEACGALSAAHELRRAAERKAAASTSGIRKPRLRLQHAVRVVVAMVELETGRCWSDLRKELFPRGVRPVTDPVGGKLHEVAAEVHHRLEVSAHAAAASVREAWSSRLQAAVEGFARAFEARARDEGALREARTLEQERRADLDRALARVDQGLRRVLPSRSARRALLRPSPDDVAQALLARADARQQAAG